MRQWYAPYMGCGRKRRPSVQREMLVIQTGRLDAEDGKVKAGEGERGGKTWSEHAAARDSAGWGEQAVASEGSHLKM